MHGQKCNTANPCARFRAPSVRQISEERPQHEGQQQERKRERHPDEYARALDQLRALGKDMSRLLTDPLDVARTLRQTRQPLTLLRQSLRLSFDGLRLAFELQPLAVADLLEQANDAPRVLFGHGSSPRCMAWHSLCK